MYHNGLDFRPQASSYIGDTKHVTQKREKREQGLQSSSGIATGDSHRLMIQLGIIVGDECWRDMEME